MEKTVLHKLKSVCGQLQAENKLFVKVWISTDVCGSRQLINIEEMGFPIVKHTLNISETYWGLCS